jgi:hypothetical protein
MKAEGHLGRCYLKGRAGDAAVILSAVGLQPSPRSCLAEDHFARHHARATPDLHNSTSPQTDFLTGDSVAHFDKLEIISRRQ